MSDDRQYVAYGGRVTWKDFVVFPSIIPFAALPQLVLSPKWLSVAILAFAAWGIVALGIIYSLSAFNARSWVSGSRIQLPLILTSFFLAEVVWFSSLYVLISHANESAFNQPLDWVGALYFSLATLTTTGFGDINAVSQAARLAVSAEMLCSIITIVVLISVGVSKAYEEFKPPSIKMRDSDGKWREIGQGD